MQIGTVLALSMLATTAQAQVEVEEYELDNGMSFLLVPRTEQPNNIAAGWLAHVGSVNERPGITGISHFFEHMMFKGTPTIGTNDAEKDAWFRAEQERVRMQLRDLQTGLNYERYRNGEIDNPWDAAHDTPEMAALRTELNTLIEDHREVIVKDEFDSVYTSLGASGMNAFTSEDVTFYFITVPSNKIEGWAWMESDRLTNSVFREFYSERDVVHEERRMRTESTPTGIYDEQFEALFWTSSPYSHPVIGWPSDLNSYTMGQAREYFDTYYAPNNLTGVIVGDFKIEEIKPVIDKYFSHLEAGPAAPPVITTEVPQLAEKRMSAECDCPNQVTLKYHAVPYGHPDYFRLEVMASVLNGRTGRLYKELVEGQEIATSARARIDARKYAGAFEVTLEAKAGVEPAQLEAAWEAILADFQANPVDERELQKVKNQTAADSFRQLQDNFWLLVQVGYAERLGGWEWLNKEPTIIADVKPSELQAVADKYFEVTNRAVAVYTRSADAVPDSPEFLAATESLPPQAVGMIRGQLKQINAITDPAEVEQAIAGIRAQMGQVPPEFKAAMGFMLDQASARLAELKGGN